MTNKAEIAFKQYSEADDDIQMWTVTPIEDNTCAVVIILDSPENYDEQDLADEDFSYIGDKIFAAASCTDINGYCEENESDEEHYCQHISAVIEMLE